MNGAPYYDNGAVIRGITSLQIYGEDIEVTPTPDPSPIPTNTPVPSPGDLPAAYSHNNFNDTVLPEVLTGLLSSTGYPPTVDGAISFTREYVTYFNILAFITFIYIFMKRN
jgi:hypothetical protein